MYKICLTGQPVKAELMPQVCCRFPLMQLQSKETNYPFKKETSKIKLNISLEKKIKNLVCPYEERIFLPNGTAQYRPVKESSY